MCVQPKSGAVTSMSQDVTHQTHFNPLPASWPLWHALRAVIRTGHLIVRDWKGDEHNFGDGAGRTVRVHFTDASMPKELLLDPYLALGEGYIEGRVVIEAGGLSELLGLFAKNIATRDLPPFMRLADGFRKLTRYIRQLNRLRRARRNVAHHYDLPSYLYDLFLDESRQYSCAYFPSGNETLEEAQFAKMRLIARKLCISPGQRILDIGSGWGGLAIHLAREHSAQVRGITLSEEQARFSSDRIRKERVPGVSIDLKDYRTLEETFDRIVSVGMFEHVGLPNYGKFFQRINRNLEKDGIVLIHTIGRLSGPGRTDPFIEKYIFPGGYVPALSEILPHIEASGLLVTDIEILRLHYAKTLKLWRDNFERSRDRVANVMSDRFCRMWEYYLAGSEVAFRYQDLAVFHIQLAKKIDAVPLTRQYLQEGLRSTV